MIVEVKLFAAARQTAGADTIQVELPGGATIADLRHVMQRDYPDMAAVLARAMFAVNTDYAADEAVIPAGAEVACIPPVSGG